MKKGLIFFSLVFCGFNASAETAICTGSVERLAYHQPDGLWLALGSTPIFKVCSPESLFKRTSPENCRFIASLVTTARATGKNLSVYIDNAPTTSCSDIPNWFEADVRFVELLK